MFLCAGMSMPMQYSILDARNARNVLKTLEKKIQMWIVKQKILRCKSYCRGFPVSLKYSWRPQK